MKNNYKLGVIGAGNMAKAIVNGIVDANILDKNDIIVSDPFGSIGIDGIETIKDNDIVLEGSEYILLAIKPQVFREISSSLKEKCKAKHIISIMAGITYDMLVSVFGENINITRVMPNTPCKLKQGMTAIRENDNIPKEEKRFVERIFLSIGDIVYLDESLFHTITCVSGSGPAYVYMFIEAMIDSGVENGLTYSQAKKAVLKTFEGAVAMVRYEDKSISELIDAVCSKGGTTIEAVNSFREDNLYEIVDKAMTKCKNRSEELGK